MLPRALPESADDEGPPVSPSHPGVPDRFGPHCWITGNPAIGEGTWIGAFTLIDGQGGLTIGRGCNISSGAQILTHSTVRRCLTERRYPHVDRRPTIIEDNVFIGANAVILMGARVGHHSVIAAGAVVLEDAVIPPYALVAGVPYRARDHYEVIHVGWDGVRRVHGAVVHIDISGGKVWIQYEGTSRPVADELVAAGIPREDIVLGFHPAELRPLTGYGVV
jgi:acetyltransferase-like isoleucine patch superfamily enzyme